MERRDDMAVGHKKAKRKPGGGRKKSNVSNLPIFGHFCHPIFAHKNTKKAAEAAVL